MIARPGVWVVGMGVAAAAGAVALGALVTATDDPPSSPASAPPGRSTASAAPDTVPTQPWDAKQSADAFFSGYVDPDGRVVRRDQGGDTVSEGQAYAMLIAVGVGRVQDFHAVWDWTREHLRRPDGLFSWRWSGGRVVDAESASDADLDIARALVLAGRAFDDAALVAEGTLVGEAVLDHETIRTGTGRILLAGTWVDRSPYAVNPSYASPAATSVLDEASSDPRWDELDEGNRAVASELTQGQALPPNWAQVHEDGRVEVMPGPTGDTGAVRYGYDAARMPIRYAESCDDADRSIVADLAGILNRHTPLPAELDLGGGLLNRRSEHPVGYAARAATRAAAGDLLGARADLAAADRVQQQAPTYYGAAWSATARLILDEGGLGGCPPAADR